MDVFGIVAVLSLLIYLVVGIYVSRRLKSADDYYVMGRRAPATLIVGTLIASNISSGAFIAYTGGVFSDGPGPYMLFWPSMWIQLLLAFWLGRYFLPLKLWTVPDYFVGRFPSTRIGVLAMLIVLVSVTLYLVYVMMTTAVATAGLLGWSFELSLISGLLIIAIFTIVGGMWGVVVTDTVMFLLFMVAALAVMPFIISAAGGWPGAFQTASQKLPQMMTWHGKMAPAAGFDFIVQVGIASATLGLAAPHLLSRVFLTSSPKVLARAMVTAPLFYVVYIVGFLFVMGLTPLVAPADTKPVDIYPWVARNLVPPVLGAIALSGVIAAALSTASSLLQQAAAGLSRDVYQRFINPNVSDSRLITISRITVAVVAIITYFGVTTRAVTYMGAINIFLFACSMWAAWVPPLLGGLLTKRTTESGAFWGMATGAGLALISGVLQSIGVKPIWMPPPIILALGASIIVTWIVSVKTSPRTGESDFFDRSRPAAVAN